MWQIIVIFGLKKAENHVKLYTVQKVKMTVIIIFGNLLLQWTWFLCNIIQKEKIP